MKNFLLIFQALSILHFNGLAQDIVSYSYSECDETCDYDRIVNRISAQTLKQDTLTLYFGTISNCAGIHNPTAGLSGDTLRISYEDFITTVDTLMNGDIRALETIVMCDCYYDSEFVLAGITTDPKVILLQDEVIEYYPDKYRLFPVTFEIDDGDTVNYTDKYGFPQGKWISDYPNGGYSVGYQKDGEYLSLDRVIYTSENQIRSIYQKDTLGRGFGRSYYDNQNLESIFIEPEGNKQNRIRYYKNGNVQSLQTTNDDYHDPPVTYSNDLSVTYYENGNIKKISSRDVWNEYYENGPLKIRRLYSDNPLHIWSMYYYDNGNIMAIHYIKDQGGGTSKRWWDCYAIDGKKVSKQFLVDHGYDFIRD